MKQKSKIVEIPATATIAQMQTALDAMLKDGWVLIAVFTLGTKTYAVLTKTMAM